MESLILSLSLLLGCSLGLGGLLPVASNHDDTKEGADDSGADKEEDDGDADGPDAGKEEVLERMVVIDEGHQKSPDRVVEKDDGGSHEHGEADEFVEHCRCAKKTWQLLLLLSFREKLV
jgi:hypothetical protein